MNKKLVDKVLKDLKDIVPYKEGIAWKDFTSVRKLGYYHISENTIYLNEYLVDDEQELLNTIAHELIHSAGVHNHGKEFKKYAELVNGLNLGYRVSTHYEGKDLTKIFKQKQKEYRASRPKYEVYCTECDSARVYNFKHHDLSKYRCKKCKGKLKQRKVVENDKK